MMVKEAIPFISLFFFLSPPNKAKQIPVGILFNQLTVIFPCMADSYYNSYWGVGSHIIPLRMSNGLIFHLQ